MAEVTLKSVRKVYSNGHVGVERTDFSVVDGELLVLVGPSGCGKSTLLRLIAGLEEVTEGTIYIGNRDVTQLDPRDRDIAMVFQSYALYPHMTVGENLGFGLKLRGHATDEVARRVEEAATALELTTLLDRLPKQLSGGQRQRVALGRALVRHPQVFLLDEPLSNLDAKLRTTMRTEITRLHRSLKTTMIYVTHDQVEAMTLGQRIVVLNEGVVQQIDAPMRIYERPVNLFVAGFLGNPAMNLLRGELRDSSGLTIAGRDTNLTLGARQHHDALQAHVNKEVVAGIRPEDLRLTSAGVNEISITAGVELIETVGNESFIHARLGSWALVARVSPHDLPQTGSDVALYIAVDRLHFFDAATGSRIEQNP